MNLKFNNSDGRYPELAPIRNELHRLKIMWVLCCLSPLAYLGLALYVTQKWFSWREQRGLFKFSDQTYLILAIVFGLMALALEAVILLIRKRYDERMRAAGRAVVQLMELYSRRTFILVALCETAIMIGFVFFLLSGRLDAVLASGILGLLYYAQSYPSEQGLGEITANA